jgi:23S rRNA U2552 (ribose-2'-O)-methylase RlmE/FtsJ
MECFDLVCGGPGGPVTIALKPGESSHSPTSPVLCSPQWHTLQLAKNEINSCYQEGKWDDYKKVTNPYEYIFLSWNRRSSRSVAIRQPLSRSYFKLVELWKTLDLSTRLAPLVQRDGGLVTAHAAEGPGGFIEACTVMAERKSWSFKGATAITLRSDAKKIPGWRKAQHFLASYPNIIIHDGADGTGDILKKANQAAYVAAVRKESPRGVHLYTADGGFDFSGDYNAQEDAIFPLLLAETVLGLKVLAKGGALLIKCFDTTEQQTVDLLWLITRAFCEWRVVKPRTSRTGNSERYIVGLGFLGSADDILALLDRETFSLATPTCPSYRETLAQLLLLQERVEQAELVVIRDTLDLMKATEGEILKALVRQNVLRSIAWCKMHDEEVAMCWETDMDRNLERETLDLLSILQSDSHHSSWAPRPPGSTSGFSTFRVSRGTLTLV